MQAARQEMEPNTTSFWIFLLLPESSWLQKDGLHMFEPRKAPELGEAKSARLLRRRAKGARWSKGFSGEAGKSSERFGHQFLTSSRGQLVDLETSPRG